jgi:hypothetical protein
MPFSANTGYVNSIEPADEEHSPGNLELEEEVVGVLAEGVTRHHVARQVEEDRAGRVDLEGEHGGGGPIVVPFLGGLACDFENQGRGDLHLVDPALVKTLRVGIGLGIHYIATTLTFVTISRTR